LQGRGKKVTAEIIFKKEVLEKELRVTATQLDYHQAVGNIGAFMSGTNNNGLHSVNAITTMFIDTGQDVARVAESLACLTQMGCYGEGKAKKLAKIVAGVVLAGEISLAAAISSADWVSSHKSMGRNK
jgi:hydroxymethylglutaryl-CoA reductase (NADPH)